MNETALHVKRLGSGPRIVFVHGSTSDGGESFSAQRPLADRFTVELLDRRGFGGSTDPPGPVDFDRDAADLIEVVGPAGAHVVGHSYGGLVGMVAAGAAPDRVRSLTVIEPPAFSVIPDHPAVIQLRARLEFLFPAPAGMGPQEWLSTFSSGLGFPPFAAELDAREIRNIRSTMTERPAWEARIPLDAIRGAGLPVLVVRGGWEPLPTAAEIGGAFFGAVCDRIVEALGAESAALPDTFHGPHGTGAPFNKILADFVLRAEAVRTSA